MKQPEAIENEPNSFSDDDGWPLPPKQPKLDPKIETKQSSK